MPENNKPADGVNQHNADADNKPDWVAQLNKAQPQHPRHGAESALDALKRQQAQSGEWQL